jgi:hypothetical protein
MEETFMKPTFLHRNMTFIAGTIMLGLSLAFSTFSVMRVFSAPLAAPPAPVSVPEKVSLEGLLTNASGRPLASGAYTMTFKVWDAATQGNLKWSETQPNVPVTNGFYSVQLGSVTSFTIDTFQGDRWIGVTPYVTATETISRSSIGSVPFALNAKNADMVDNLHAATSGADAHVVASDSSGALSISGGLNVGAATGAAAGQVIAPAGASSLLPFATYQGMYNLSTNTAVCVHTLDRNGTLTRWAQAWLVPATNNSKDYWTISVRRMDTLTTLASFTTAGSPAGTWTRYASGALAIPVTTSMIGIDIYVAKTGNPGNLSLGHPAIYVP